MMHKTAIVLLAASLLSLGSGCSSLSRLWPDQSELVVPTNRLVLVVPESAAPEAQLAAQEIQTYLAEISGRPLDLQRTPDTDQETVNIHIGICPPGSSLPLQPGAGTYEVRDGEIFIYGKDNLAVDSKSSINDVLGSGTLVTAYSFLANECGVRWIMPGKGNAVVPRSEQLTFHRGRREVKPSLLSLTILVPEELDVPELRLWLCRNLMRGAIAPLANSEDGSVLRMTGLPIPMAEDIHRHLRRGLRKGGLKPLPLCFDGSWFAARNLYTAVRTVRDRRTPFSQIAQDFCSAFGNAAPDVQAYFTCWRELAENSGLSEPKLGGEGGVEDLRRELLSIAATVCKPAAFRQAAAFLHQALEKSLTDLAKSRVQQLILNHEHARLTYLALDRGPEERRSKNAIAGAVIHSRHLADFRAAPVADYAWYPTHLSQVENTLGDITGMHFAAATTNMEPAYLLPLVWYWYAGEQKVHSFTAEELAKTKLATVRLDRFWKDQELPAREAESSQQAAFILQSSELPVKDQMFLVFKGVNADLELFVNGKPVGTHDRQADSPTPTSFAFRIDPFIERSRENQVLSLEISNDPEGLGIWQQIWLFSKPNVDEKAKK